MQQVLPRGKDQEGGDGGEIVEELAAGAEFLPGSAPEFFGDVADEIALALREKLSGIEFGAFFLSIVGVGTFSAKGAPKIIWIGVGKAHPHLFQIYKRVHEAALAAGLEPELRPWHPHITIARCRDVAPQSLRSFLQSNEDLDAGMIRVDAFHLYSSKLTPAGPIHTHELSVLCRE